MRWYAVVTTLIDLGSTTLLRMMKAIMNSSFKSLPYTKSTQSLIQLRAPNYPNPTFSTSDNLHEKILIAPSFIPTSSK